MWIKHNSISIPIANLFLVFQLLPENIFWQPLKWTDSVTDTKAAELCINWDIIGVTIVVWTLDTWNNVFVECERSQTRLRDLCVNLSANSLLCRRHQRPQRESRHFFFIPSKQKCCFVIVLVSVKIVIAALHSTCNTHFLCDLQPCQTNGSNLHTDSSRGGERGGGWGGE